MDLLAQRYADPFLMLDNFIRIGQLHEFSVEIMKQISDEKVQDIRWEYYLHKVWDMSFNDYVASCEEERREPEVIAMQKEEALQIIENSNSILEEFSL